MRRKRHKLSDLEHQKVDFWHGTLIRPLFGGFAVNESKAQDGVASFATVKGRYMRRGFVLTLLFCAFACGLYAQDVVDTTVCAVLKNPTAFNGKTVRIKGTVVVGFDQFVVNDTDCGLKVNGIWIAYPEGEKIKAGPIALLTLRPAHNFAGTLPTARTAVTLTRDKGFKDFEALLSKEYTQTYGICLGCERNAAQATLVGRLDGVADAALIRDSGGKVVGLGGFGNMNAYPARLVLESVADVTPVKEDYTKVEEAMRSARTNGENPSFQFDPLASAQKLAAAFGSSPMGLRAQQDVAEFGKPHEPNGTIIEYGAMDDVSAKENALGDADSPDGVLYDCTFNPDRLKATALSLAILHMGQHISDLRMALTGNPGVPVYTLEYNAWMLTSGSAVTARLMYLTAPGGYLIWNTTWSPASSNANIMAAVKSYLAGHDHLTE